jgi:hypothetical protein
MKDAKDTDHGFGNFICRDVRRPLNDKFAGAGNSANTTARGKFPQPADGGNDPLIDQNGR